MLSTYTADGDPEEVLKLAKIPGKRRREIAKAFERFGRAPTLLEVEAYFNDKIAELEKEISQTKRDAQTTLGLAKDFWTIVKQHQAARIKETVGRNKARPRKVAAKSRRL